VPVGENLRLFSWLRMRMVVLSSDPLNALIPSNLLGVGFPSLIKSPWREMMM
jgi:hypothetical protein